MNGAWPPPLLQLADHDGDWSAYLNALYAVFLEDFVVTPPIVFHPKRFAMKRYPMERGKEATFWHLISVGGHEDQRLPDLRRCERIRWPRALIDAYGTGRVRSWKKWHGGGDLRIVIALTDFSYVVILKEATEYVLLWTAYCVETKHQRAKLEREYFEFGAPLEMRVPPP
jgi:hypothetical protein